MNYENLFRPGYIGGLRIKNRVVMTAMGNGLAAENGEASDEIIACYKARAAGGCGLLITEFCAVDGENGIAETHQLQIHAPRFIKRLALLTDTLHRYDCKVFFQLFHPGREGKPQFNGGRQVISASGIVNPATGRVSHEMTREEIHGMVDKFVTGAVYAQQANADGVELHCAHGYLLHQFLSPHSNVRTDEYGGCLENRMRIVREIIEGIHCACGRDFPISVRINGCDYIPEGLQKADAVEIAKLLERYGVSCINVSSGGYENPAAFIEPCYFPEGWKKENALAVKAAVQIPVIAVNVIKHPATAEALLREGVCDFAGVSRAQLADPDWVGKARSGQEPLLRKCIGCMNCFKQAGLGRAIECAVNPVLGRETYRGDDKLIKNGDGRTVAVIGAGPSGLQAAIPLAKRVVVLEKSDRIGGNMNLAAVPPCKGLISEFIETLGIEAADLGIDIRLNTPGTVEAAKAVGAVGVVIAAGGIDIIPQVDGIDKAYTYRQVLKNEVELKGKKIAVIGGGLTGLETAEYLSDFDNEVSVIEMAPAVGTAMYRSVTDAVVGHITKNGGHIMTGTMFKAVGDGFVTLNSLATGYDTDALFDACVIAMGVKPNDAIVAEFEAAFDKVAVVGDTVEPGNIADATHSGLNKAFVF